MKKNTLLLLSIFFCVTYLSAQSEKTENNATLSNEKVFKHAELVFEGFKQRLVYTYNPLGNLKNEDTYAITSYYVQKVYKGNHALEGTTIYITCKGADLGIENYIAFDYLEERAIGTPFLKENGILGITSTSPAIFFLVYSDFPDDENSIYFQYEKYKSMGHRFNLYVNDDKFAGDNNLAFKNREDLYRYMKQFEGYRTPEPALLPEKQIEKELNDTIIEQTFDEYMDNFLRKGGIIMEKKEDNLKSASKKNCG